MEMPLTVSLMAALTSAMACMPRLGDAPRQAAEADGNAHEDGDEGEQQQRHVPLGADHDHRQDDDLQELGADVGDDDDQLPEVVACQR